MTDMSKTYKLHSMSMTAMNSSSITCPDSEITAPVFAVSFAKVTSVNGNYFHVCGLTNCQNPFYEISVSNQLNQSTPSKTKRKEKDRRSVRKILSPQTIPPWRFLATSLSDSSFPATLSGACRAAKEISGFLPSLLMLTPTRRRECSPPDMFLPPFYSAVEE